MYFVPIRWMGQQANTASIIPPSAACIALVTGDVASSYHCSHQRLKYILYCWNQRRTLPDVACAESELLRSSLLRLPLIPDSKNLFDNRAMMARIFEYVLGYEDQCSLVTLLFTSSVPYRDDARPTY